jgi:predicted dehydrogenase
MRKIRAAVVGVGYLGRFHAQKYAQAADCELVAVVDARRESREQVGRELATEALADHRELLGRVDAVSVVTPTPAHFAIARELLAAGVHVLVEKPITETADEARELIELARARGRILQVGHLERFNAAILAAEPYLTAPRFIECHRLAPYKERGTDVNVVLDLMIHDIDVVATLVGDEVLSVEGVGVPVLTPRVDIANARLRFSRGCVANITASRVSQEKVRKLRVFERDRYVSLDYQTQEAVSYRLVPGSGPRPDIRKEELPVKRDEPLRREIEDFLRCARDGSRPKVSGEEGMRALDLALRVVSAIEETSGAGRK